MLAKCASRYDPVSYFLFHLRCSRLQGLQFVSLSINRTPMSTDREFSRPAYSHFQVCLGQAVRQDKRPKRLSAREV